MFFFAATLCLGLSKRAPAHALDCRGLLQFVMPNCRPELACAPDQQASSDERERSHRNCTGYRRPKRGTVQLVLPSHTDEVMNSVSKMQGNYQHSDSARDVQDSHEFLLPKSEPSFRRTEYSSKNYLDEASGHGKLFPQLRAIC
jgi:hypothetical protein